MSINFRTEAEKAERTEKAVRAANEAKQFGMKKRSQPKAKGLSKTGRKL